MITRYRQGRRFATVVLVTMACGFMGRLAQAQSDDLVTAAKRGDLAAVNMLLKSGIDVNKYTPGGTTTALIEASSGGHLDVVKALLAAKADVNAKRVNTGQGETALMQASQKGHLEVVQALLAANADVNANGGSGTTALLMASQEGRLEVVKALVAAKADLNPKLTILGRTALMLALMAGHWDVARTLTEAGANVNTMTRDGITPLKLAARGGQKGLAAVEALLAAHADINGGFVSGETTIPPPFVGGGGTVLGIASSIGSVEMVRVLLAANTRVAVNPGVAVNAKQPGGNTPLTLASEKGFAGIVRLLLAEKADVNAKRDDGSSALVLALQYNHQEVAELLRSAIAAAPEAN